MRRRGIVLFALAIFCVIGGVSLTPAVSIAAQLQLPRTPGGIATDPILQPPYEADGKPIDIVIGLHVVNLSSINEVEEQFQLDAYLFARWKDPRLAYTSEGPQDRIRNYASGQIWIPQTRDNQCGQSPHPRRRFDHASARTAA